jgi:hypothetical protein
MVRVAVTLLTVHSPATERLPPVSSPLPLLTTVHDHMHDASDWMYHYDQPLTDEDMYLWAEEYAKEQFPSGVSDSQHPKWNVDSSGKDVIVTFGNSRKRVWKIAQEEIKAYRQRVKQLSGKEFQDIDPLKDVLQLYLGKARPLIQLMEFSLNRTKRSCTFLAPIVFRSHVIYLFLNCMMMKMIESRCQISCRNLSIELYGN